VYFDLIIFENSFTFAKGYTTQRTMYKWHVHSAIGRGRPHFGDFAKVADGIAASLRQFHVSVARTAGDGG